MTDDDKKSNSSLPGTSSSESSLPPVPPSATAKLLLSTSLYKMTDGLPRRELKLIVAEAQECEKDLQEELHILQKALEAEQQQQQQQQEEEDDGDDKKNEKKKVEKDDDDNNDDDEDEADVVVNTMLESEATPLDHHWTLSALLGRLRHDLTTPLPPHSQIPLVREQNGLGQLHASLASPFPPYLRKKRVHVSIQQQQQQQQSFSSTNNNTIKNNNNDGGGGGGGGGASPTGSGRSTPSGSVGGGGIGGGWTVGEEISQFQRLADLEDHPSFRREHATPDKLQALWKKISTHKSSLVFRRPVNPKDAPGYSDRIIFPMDLSMIRKLIGARTIRSYHGFSQNVALVCHNCVKYNGRESDYALVTREFESVASEYIWSAVQEEGVGAGGGGNELSSIAEEAATLAAKRIAAGGAIVGSVDGNKKLKLQDEGSGSASDQNKETMKAKSDDTTAASTTVSFPTETASAPMDASLRKDANAKLAAIETKLQNDAPVGEPKAT